MKTTRWLWVVLFSVAVAACGGGGNSSTAHDSTATGVIGAGGGSISLGNGTVATINPGVVKDGTTVSVQTMSAPVSSSPAISASSPLVRIEIPDGAFSTSGVPTTTGITVNIPYSSSPTGVAGATTVSTAYKYITAIIGGSVLYGTYLDKTVGNQAFAITSLTLQQIKQQANLGNPLTQGNPLIIDFFVNTYTPYITTAGQLFEVIPTKDANGNFITDNKGDLLVSFKDSLLPTKTIVPPGKLPLVLVHGITTSCFGDYAAYKETWMKFITNFFLDPALKDKYQLYTYSYQTDLSIQSNGSLLDYRLKASFGALSPVVVAHSMGGLVTRSAIVHDAAIIGGVITLGTPHHGTKRFQSMAGFIDSYICLAALNAKGAKDLAWDDFDNPSVGNFLSVEAGNPFLRGPNGLNTLDNVNNYKKYIPYAGVWDSTSLRCVTDLVSGLLAIALDTVSYGMCVGANELKSVGYSSSDGMVPLVSARFTDYVSAQYKDKNSWRNLNPRTYLDIHHVSIHDDAKVFTQNPDGTVGGVRADLLDFYQSIISSIPALSPAFTTNLSGLQASFNASSSTTNANITSYSWNFGDGTTATGITASHTYASYSTVPWTVTLTVTDSYGRTASTSQNVSIQIPTLTIAPANPSVVSGLSVQLTASAKDSAGNPITLPSGLTWSSNNAGLTVSNTGLVTAAANATGSSVLTLTDSASGATASTTVTVTQGCNSITQGGLTWSPICAANAVQKDWPGANAYCTNMGARLPTQTELVALFNSGVLSTAAAQGWTLFNTWSSTPVSGTHYIVGLQFGYVGSAFDTYVGAYATCVRTNTSATVTQLPVLSITPANPSVAPGSSVQLTASAKDSTGNPITLPSGLTWLSNNTGVTVSNTGLVTAAANATGSSVLTVTDPASGATASTTVTVTQVCNSIIQGGLTWSPICANSIMRDWPSADAYCTNMGGRLPTQNELVSLFNSGVLNTAGWKLDYTWSSTPHPVAGAGSHAGVTLAAGVVNWLIDTGPRSVTCVR